MNYKYLSLYETLTGNFTGDLPVVQVSEEDQVILSGNDSNLLIVFYVQIMPDDFVMQLHRF